ARLLDPPFSSRNLFAGSGILTRGWYRAYRVVCIGCLSLVSTLAFGANEAPYNSATISGLGARNIGSATMSGRISAIAGVKEPSGKITLFIGAASGGIWKSDDGGTRFRPVFDEQPVQSIGAIAIDPKN